jgi:hypothetical protein
MGASKMVVGVLSMGACLLLGASLASALPIELKDGANTKYFINTAVDPLIDTSLASGAVTNATYTKTVTVTSTFIGFTPWWGFTTVYTVQFEITEPLTPAFVGFNGLTVVGVNNVQLPDPVIYNPGEGVTEECMQGNANRQLVFQPQSFPTHNLTLQRKVFVPHNDEFVRWLNIITNDGSAEAEFDVSLIGRLASAKDTEVTHTSSGSSSLGTDDTWFTTAQQLPDNERSFQPRLGFVVQGENATSPVQQLGINGLGQMASTYHVTVPAGGSVILLTYTTVQGKTKTAKEKVSGLVSLPSKGISCMTEQELAQVVNFAPITVPVTTKAKIKLVFNKTGADTVQWKGTAQIGAGINLTQLPVTVDVAGVEQNFLLNKKGKGNDGNGNSFSLKAKLSNGVTQAGDFKFIIKLKGDYQTALASYGWENATVNDVPLTAPMSISVPGGQFNLDESFSYSAKQGKSGTGTGQ